MLILSINIHDEVANLQHENWATTYVLGAKAGRVRALQRPHRAQLDIL